MKNFSFFLFLFLITFSACRKNIDEVDVTTETPEPTILEGYNPTLIQVNGDLTGFVYDENKEPIQAAQITLGGLSTMTDEYGHFFFTDIDMNAAGTVLNVEKEGFFMGSRRFQAVNDTENRVKVELLEKEFTQSFEASTGGTITLEENGSISFSANSIQNADGTPYGGLVRVASRWMNPSDLNTYDQMPGNLFGVDNRGEEVVLGTLGMIAVELESEQGEPLNILQGNTATITTPVPSNLLDNAPTEIPLWSYNQEFGVWVEEGTSRLENGNYVAQVGHFSFWNHDFPYPLVDFSAIITNENGNPLENYKVVVSIPDDWGVGYGYTCEDGNISGLVPENTVLDLEIIGLCNEVLYTIQIGPFTEATDLGTVIIPESNLLSSTATGELVDCDGVSIENGLVIISSNQGTVYEYVNSEPFEVIFSGCTTGSNFEVIGYDLNEELQSETLTASNTTVNNFGDISVCEDIEDFISLTVDGLTEIYFIDVTAFTDSTFTFIQAATASPNGFIGFGFNGNTIGNYGDLNNSIEVLADPDNDWSIVSNSNGGFENFEVTEFGVPGEKIIGNFSGTLQNFSQTNPGQVTVEGNFTVTNPN